MSDAPEPMPEKLLIKLVDNPSSVCDGMYINAAGGTEYTLTSSVAAQIKAAVMAEREWGDILANAIDNLSSEFVPQEVAIAHIKNALEIYRNRSQEDRDG